MVFFALRPGAALFLLSSFLILLPWVDADAVNRTIDDTNGDSVTNQKVVYVPATGTWHDATCLTSNGCAIVPDPSQTFGNSYTAATYRSPQEISITMQFNGTAIYVFFILANNIGNGVTTVTIANFTLDGNVPQLYTHQPDPSTSALSYNQLVYSQTNLANIQHTLIISTADLTTEAYVNFDYAIYTHEDSTSTSGTPTSGSQPTQDTNGNGKKKTPVGAIVGGVVGGLAALVALAAIFFFIARRRPQRSQNVRSEAGGFDPRLMVEANPAALSESLPRPSGSIDPFMTPEYSSRSNTGGLPLSPAHSGFHSPQASISTSKGFSTQSPSDGAYVGHVDSSSSNGRPEGAPTDRTPSSLGLAYNFSSKQLPLRSVTSGDHLSSPNTDLPTVSSHGNNIEAIRQARQKELDQRLRAVQEEMTALASDLSSDRPDRRRSIQKQMTPTRNQEVEDREMNMEEMKEQLRMMKDRIDYLTAQQQSPWAQGLSDDPPPGYTTVST